MSSDDLDQLLLAARTSNKVVGVTGVLLYGDSRFFQYFEGPAIEVNRVYDRIRRSDLHKDIAELEHRQIAHRIFHDWYMGYRHAPETMLQKLSQETWDRELPWAKDHATESSGVRALIEFFNSTPSDD
jgi:hypothetical protein